MSKQTRARHPIYNLLPTEIEGFHSLAELALDMRWSWNHATDEVWRQLDPELWEITHNPWVVLQTVSRDRIERVLADPEVLYPGRERYSHRMGQADAGEHGAVDAAFLR
jgi:starch phosphorylase